MIRLKQLLKEIEDYKGEHEAPGPEDAPLYDLTLNGIYPKDVYETLHHYKNHDIHDNETMSIIRNHRNKPNSNVYIYRSVPKDVVGAKINEGDWVTITRSYAKEHGESNLNNNFKIIKSIVKAKDLWNNGSINEWGYVKNPDPKIGQRKVYTKDEMIKLGADGYLSRAILHKIPISNIDGREPVPEPDSYKPGKPITQPIEVEFDPNNGKYILYSGNHRVRQAEVNGEKYILAFVQTRQL